MMARFHIRWMSSLAALTVSATTAFAGGSQYRFNINSPTSGLNANIGVNAATTGTLSGNWDAKTNPTGTRTKPGLFGSFGADENLPVAIDLGLGLNGSPDTSTAGEFDMQFDLSGGVVNLSGFNTDLLHSGPASLTAEISLLTETFRTRNPTFFYIGGIPITVPFGQVALNSLNAAQVGDIAPGVITPIEGNRYSFTVAPLVTLTGSVDVLGQTFDLPGVPTLLPLIGEVEFTGETAQLTSIQPIELSLTQPLDLTLPETPLALPTLNPDEPANVLLNLALTEIGAEVAGTLTTNATGRLIPEPGTALLLIAALGLVRRSTRGV